MFKKFLNTIFSVKNEGIYKVVRVLGLKFSFKMQSAVLLKTIRNEQREEIRRRKHES